MIKESFDKSKNITTTKVSQAVGRHKKYSHFVHRTNRFKHLCLFSKQQQVFSRANVQIDQSNTAESQGKTVYTAFIMGQIFVSHQQVKLTKKTTTGAETV